MPHYLSYNSTRSPNRRKPGKECGLALHEKFTASRGLRHQLPLGVIRPGYCPGSTLRPAAVSPTPLLSPTVSQGYTTGLKSTALSRASLLTACIKQRISA